MTPQSTVRTSTPWRSMHSLTNLYSTPLVSRVPARQTTGFLVMRLLLCSSVPRHRAPLRCGWYPRCDGATPSRPVAPGSVACGSDGQTLCRGADLLPDAFRGEGEILDLGPGRRRGRRGPGAQDRTLAHALGSVGTWSVMVLDGAGEELKRNVLESRYPVVDGTRVEESAVGVIDELLHDRLADPHDRAALVLRGHLDGVELGADVAHRHMPGEDELTGPRVDLDLGDGAVELVERGIPAERVALAPFEPAGALAEELSPQRAERGTRGSGERNHPVRRHQHAWFVAELVDRDAAALRVHLAHLTPDVAACAHDGGAHEHGRSTRRGLQVERHDVGIAADDDHLVQRHPEFVGDGLGPDRPSALSHVRRARVHEGTTVEEQPDEALGEAGRRARLDRHRNPATVVLRQGVVPAGELHGLLDRLLPLAVGLSRVVALDERLTVLHEIAQAHPGGVEAEPLRTVGDLGLGRPADLRAAVPPHRRADRGVGQDRPRLDQNRRDPIRPGPDVAPLGHHPGCDVGVRAELVVDLHLVEQDVSLGAETGSRAHLAAGTPDRHRRLGEVQHHSTRPAGLQGEEGDQRLELRDLLAAEAAPGVRGNDTHAGERAVSYTHL